MAEIPELDGDGPLWQQIRRAVAQPILSGAWPPGGRVPSEHDLMARFGAARMTVSRALQSLAGDGLVERRRKAGTVVAARLPERPVLEIWDIAAEIEQSGERYRCDVIEQARLSAADPRRSLLAGPGRGPFLWVLCRHLAGERPVQLEERLIDLAESCGAETPDFTLVPPGRWLMQNVAWTEAEHEIYALDAPPMIAAALDMAAGEACLVVERRTWNAALPVTFARLWHPGSTRRLVGRFSRIYS